MGGLVSTRPRMRMPYDMRQFMAQIEWGTELRSGARLACLLACLVIRPKISSSVRRSNEIWRAGGRPVSLSLSLTRPLSPLIIIIIRRQREGGRERERAILFPRDSSWWIRGRPNHETSLDSRSLARQVGRHASRRRRPPPLSGQDRQDLYGQPRAEHCFRALHRSTVEVHRGAKSNPTTFICLVMYGKSPELHDARYVPPKSVVAVADAVAVAAASLIKISTSDLGLIVQNKDVTWMGAPN